jgi:hypothetical protein
VTTPGGEIADNNEDEGQEYACLSDAVIDESLDETPTIDVPKGRILTFPGKSLSSTFVKRCQHATQLLMKYLLKTRLQTPFPTELIAC